VSPLPHALVCLCGLEVAPSRSPGGRAHSYCHNDEPAYPRALLEKKRGSGVSGASRLKRTTGLQLYYVLSLPAFGPLCDIKREPITLVE